MSENREYPGNLPLLPMGWGAANLDFDGTEDFWHEVKRVTADASLGDNLDLAMGGESSPRIWLFLHSVGQGAMSAAAALEIARELGSRDQAVLILDGDDQDSKLTRWSGRHEKEGWIDLVRYGASVLTAGVALPFSGRRGYILGVGSFTPTDVEGQEIEDLIHRLKRQADDLLVVAPANDLGMLWARVADIRLLCWDRARTPAKDVDYLCSKFEAAQGNLTGLIGFGLPEAGMAFEPGEDVATTAADSAAADVNEPVDDSEILTAAEAEWEAEISQEEAADHEPLAESPEELVAEPETSGSSRVFWGVAVVSLFLIAVVSFYYLKFVRVDDFPGSQTPMVATNLPENQPEVAAEDQTQENQAMDQVPTAVDSSASIADEALDSAANEEPEQDTPAQDTLAQEVPAQDTASAQTEVTPEDPVQAEPAKPLFAMDPYLQDVGTDGWALHLFSLPDSLAAVQEAARLQRRGFQTATRPFELKDKGRWYRVYVGSFMTRKEALEARDPLLEKLKIDWARVTEF